MYTVYRKQSSCCVFSYTRYTSYCRIRHDRLDPIFEFLCMTSHHHRLHILHSNSTQTQQKKRWPPLTLKLVNGRKCFTRISLSRSQRLDFVLKCLRAYNVVFYCTTIKIDICLEMSDLDLVLKQQVKLYPLISCLYLDREHSLLRFFLWLDILLYASLTDLQGYCNL